MKIYLVGFFTAGNVSEIRKQMYIYLADINSRSYILKDIDFMFKNNIKEINILESYYYLCKNENYMQLIKKFGNFLLDSGAYTFLSKSHKENIDWDKYLQDYANFINKYDIKLFFELDIDSIVGLEEVERLRDKLERLTGKKPIPVWHKNRGKDYFIKMCKNYPYVALGGVVIKEIPIEKYESAFNWFIRVAHENNCKIHGLGYTRLGNLKKYHFDSVDSTTWLQGNRGGFLYKFNPHLGIMDKIQRKDISARLKSREVAFHNFNEFVKFSKYAEKNL